MYTTEGVFSWKSRTVASSSDCNLRGVVVVITKAKAEESTSPINRENDKATDVHTTRKESLNNLVVVVVFTANLCCLWLWRNILLLWDLEDRASVVAFFFGNWGKWQRRKPVEIREEEEEDAAPAISFFRFSRCRWRWFRY